MSVHTPGPWAVRCEDGHAGPDDGFQPFGGCGCCNSPWMRGPSYEVKKANAQLIAAAPDLLRGLKEAREALQFANESPGGPITDTIWMMHGPETLFDFLDSLIEKAEGRTS